MPQNSQRLILLPTHVPSWPHFMWLLRTELLVAPCTRCVVWEASGHLQPGVQQRFHTLSWHQNPCRVIFMLIKMSQRYPSPGGLLLARANLMHTSHLRLVPHISISRCRIRACMKGKGNCYHFAFIDAFIYFIDVFFCPGLLLKRICISISLFIKAYN